jgi:hypothetical protein
MSLTFNSARQFRISARELGPKRAKPGGLHLPGLSISPEQGKQYRADRSALLALVALGMGFLAATSFFVAALISLTLF